MNDSDAKYSELIYHNNGFIYRTLKNDEVVWEKYYAYQSISSIGPVKIINNVDWWWNDGHERFVVKCPMFVVDFLDGKSVEFINEKFIVRHSKYIKISLKDVSKNWWLIFPYLFNDQQNVDNGCYNWIRNEQDIEQYLNDTKKVRQQLIDHFDYWKNNTKGPINV